MCRQTTPLLPLFCALLGAAPLAQAAVVTTTDNASTAGDGKTSLLEAITNVQDNETISFNIPGAGPHYILTPLTGYPLIEKDGVTIDGYTQPGALPNTSAPDLPKNAQLKIVIDSRTDNAPSLERRTVLNFPGFGDSESCVLGLKDAANATIKGLAFLGSTGGDEGDDPYVYCIALVKDSPDAKIQGCWFGLDPAMTTWKPTAEGVVAGVAGARAAVASFKWKNDPETGLTYDANGLIFGVDGDGTKDREEGNLCVGQLLAIHLETPDAVVAGNWINFLPDGSMLNFETQGILLPEDGIEAMENGDGTNMRVGTDGNGTSDLEEGNRFGPITATEFMQFWRPATGAVIAGNTFGFGLDGMPAFESPGRSLLELRNGSSFRIGTDANAPGDVLESNRIHGLEASFIRTRSGENRISLRGNVLTGNYGRVPIDDGAGVSLDTVFGDVLEDPFTNLVTLDAGSTTNLLLGVAPIQASGAEPPVLDVYLADPFGLYDGYPQGRKWLGSYNVDKAQDLKAAPGEFAFDISALRLTPAEVKHLTVTASYTLPTFSPEDPVIVVTTNFSETLQPATAPPALGGVTIAPTGTNLTLAWTGGTAPFRVFSATTPAGPWAPVSTVAGQTTVITPTPATKPREFYIIKEGAIP